MQIAPLDHLWVRGSVSEFDADKVEVGQTIRVVFPYSDRTIDEEVEYIDKAIDPETRSAKFRATIQNPEKKFKAGMFVRVLLEIPPKPGRTIIPRGSMVSVDRLEFVFLKLPGSEGRFQRRHIFVSKETSDWVIVAEPSREHLGLQRRRRRCDQRQLDTGTDVRRSAHDRGRVIHGSPDGRRGVWQTREAGHDLRPLTTTLRITAAGHVLHQFRSSTREKVSVHAGAIRLQFVAPVSR